MSTLEFSHYKKSDLIHALNCSIELMFGVKTLNLTQEYINRFIKINEIQRLLWIPNSQALAKFKEVQTEVLVMEPKDYVNRHSSNIKLQVDTYIFNVTTAPYPATWLKSLADDAQVKVKVHAKYCKELKLTFAHFTIELIDRLNLQANILRRFHFILISTNKEQNKDEWDDTYQNINEINGPHFYHVIKYFSEHNQEALKS